MSLPKLSSPFLHSGASVTQIMLQVLAALVPGLAVISWYFGPGPLLNIIVAMIFALLGEAMVMVLRARAIVFHLSDGSALVTAALFAVALPPFTPWWLTAIGVMFAVIVVKQLFGGLGQNIFNPAMAAYAMVLLAFPKEMAAWTWPYGLSEKFNASAYLLQQIPDRVFDGISQATPLDDFDIRSTAGEIGDVILRGDLYGTAGGYAWETIALAFFLGGCWLLYKRLISWHIPVSLLLTVFLVSGAWYIADPNRYAPPTFHLLNGAVVIGAFFIATDPVTAPFTAPGKILFGIGVGILTVFIRLWGAFPDGVAFAVLLMNMVTPLLDQFSQPRVFGHR